MDEIDVTEYHGAAGDTIRVRVTDDFKVMQVNVAIYNDDGTMVEQGDAVEQENGLDWLFTATNENLTGDKIVIQASDKPGIATEQEQIL